MNTEHEVTPVPDDQESQAIREGIEQRLADSLETALKLGEGVVYVQIVDGELLMFFTDAEKRLDAANQSAAQRELLAQARGEPPLRLARGAAIRAVEQSFAMPLRAAGVDAQVTARFR